MRSRYTAYATGNTAYLIATTAPESPHFQPDRAAWKADLDRYCAAVRFGGLAIHGASGDRVQFFARMTFEDTDRSFGEDSAFIQRDGRWFYVDGRPFQP